jgi:hypothetical protein
MFGEGRNVRGGVISVLSAEIHPAATVVWTGSRGFVEPEATPQLLLKLGIQLRLTGRSLSNTVPIPDVFGSTRARSTRFR